MFTEEGNTKVMGALTKLLEPAMYDFQIAISVLLEVCGVVANYQSGGCKVCSD